MTKEERNEYIQKAKFYIKEYGNKGLDIPEGFPDEISDDELKDFVWTWDEYDPASGS